MDYLKELAAIQTWIKAAAGLNSYRLKEAKPKVARPVILWEIPSRSKDRNLSQYLYVNKVRQYGKLFVSSLEEADRIQEDLTKDLEDRYNIIPIMDGVNTIARLKAVQLEFNEANGLDIPFSVVYEVTYSRTRPQDPPPATKVGTKVTVNQNDDKGVIEWQR